MDAASWKPRPFTEEELKDIDPVTRRYMADVDRTLLIESLKLTVTQRIMRAEQCLADAAELQRSVREQSK